MITTWNGLETCVIYVEIKLALEAFAENQLRIRILFKVFFQARITKKNSDYKSTEGVEFDMSQFMYLGLWKKYPKG